VLTRIVSDRVGTVAGRVKVAPPLVPQSAEANCRPTPSIHEAKRSIVGWHDDFDEFAMNFA